MITCDGRSFFRQYDKSTEDEWADFLRAARDQFGRLFMILDKVSLYKAEIIRETLKDLDGEVDLEFSPPGCPDLNTIE